MMEAKTLALGIGALMVFAGVVLCLVWWYMLARPWFRGLLGGGYVPLAQIIGMRLRGTPPLLVIDTYVTLIHREVRTSVETIESTYMAHRGKDMDAGQLATLVEERLNQSRKAA